MPPRNHPSASGFASAARVLFESAQKMGAVKPLDREGKLRASRLSKLPDHNLTQSGKSLDNVSHKIGEFLAMQRSTPFLRAAPPSQPVSLSTSTLTRKLQTSSPLDSTTNPTTLLSSSSPHTTIARKSTATSTTLRPTASTHTNGNKPVVGDVRHPPTMAQVWARTDWEQTKNAAEIEPTVSVSASNSGADRKQSQQRSEAGDAAVSRTTAALDKYAGLRASVRDVYNTTTTQLNATNLLNANDMTQHKAATTNTASAVDEVVIMEDEPLFKVAPAPVFPEVNSSSLLKTYAAKKEEEEPRRTHGAMHTEANNNSGVELSSSHIRTNASTDLNATSSLTAVDGDTSVVVLVEQVVSNTPKSALHETNPEEEDQEGVNRLLDLVTDEGGSMLHDNESDDTLTVDAWGIQREQEIARMRARLDEEEQQRQLTLRQHECDRLGQEWVRARTTTILTSTISALPSTSSAITSGLQTSSSHTEASMLHEIQRARNVAEALQHIDAMMAQGARTAACLPAAFALLQHRMQRASWQDRADIIEYLTSVLQRSTLSPAVAAPIRLWLTSGEELLRHYNTLAPSVRNTLSAPVVQRVMATLVRSKQAAEAIELVRQWREVCGTRAERMELQLVRLAQSLDDTGRAEVSTYVSQTLQRCGRLNTQAKLALARLERGQKRRNTLLQLIAASDADESVYAELIMRSDKPHVQQYLIEMGERGLNNSTDLVILRAVACATLRNESMVHVFAEIDRQVALLGIRRFHFDVALRACTATASSEGEKSVSEDGLQRTLALMQGMALPTFVWAMRKILPALYATGMFADIVALYDRTAESVPFAKLWPNVTAFINDALRRVNREPLTDTTAQHMTLALYSHSSASSSSSSSDSSQDQHRKMAISSAVTPSYDMARLTERMLVLAKDRDWAKALAVVDSFCAAPGESAAAVTLIYNCALGAAVEQPEVMMKVYALMQQRRCAINATTINTVHTGLTRAQKWDDAIALYHSADPAHVDANTFLMQLSLLGKRGLWEEAVMVYNTARAKQNKLPVAIYKLAINATAPHSWQSAFNILNDMAKVHGLHGQTSVVHQVVRCLERNGRTAELAKVVELTRKTTKKKK